MWTLDQLERGEEAHPRRGIAVLAPLFSALFVGTLVVIGGYFTARQGSVDEIGLYNPVYMMVQYGHMSYPIHGYFDAMFVHPPVHYAVIALLMKAGLPLYYAEATPTVVISLLTVLVVATSSFPWQLKCGLILGLYAPIAFFSSGDLAFGTRPEFHIAVAFMLGLVLLETARLEQWNRPKLIFGSFMVAYAAGLHYYAVAAVAAPVVYAVYAVRERGWRQARPIILALVVGSACFGIPYVWLFVWPYLRDILTLVRQVEGVSGGSSPFQLHRLQYQYWAMNGFGPPWMRWLFAIGCPLVLASTVLLLVCFPAHRVLVFAALPLQAYILLFARHKSSGYFTHEIQLYSAAVVAAALVVAERLTAKLPSRRLAALAMLVIVGVAALGFVDRETLVNRTRLRRFVHNSEIARAAARAMLGDNARVGGHLALWYASGAAHWYRIDPDVLWIRRPAVDLREYLSRFDAVAESTHMSNVTLNERGFAMSSWYANGGLKLRGFFFIDDDPALSYLLLTPQPPSHLVGYAAAVDSTYRFDEDDRGDYEITSLVCRKPGPGVEQWKAKARWTQIMYLPPDLSSYVMTTLGRRADLGGISPPADECGPVYRAAVRMTTVDMEAMVAGLRRDDRPIRFYSSFDGLPDSEGRPADAIGEPPSGEVTEIPQVLVLDTISTSYNKAKITRHGAVTVDTGPGLGAFGAFIHLKHPKPPLSDAWIRVRLRVTRGLISLAAYNGRRSEFIKQSIPIGPGDRTVTVYLHIDQFQDIDDLVIQGGEANMSSEVIIETTDVLVAAGRASVRLATSAAK